MKWLALGAMMAVWATSANAEFNTPNITRTPDKIYSPEVAFILHDVTRGCNGIIDIDSENVAMINVQWVGNGIYKEVLWAKINNQELHNAVWNISIDNVWILESCIQDIEWLIKHQNLDGWIKKELQEILWIIKEPIEDPDGYDQLLIERRVQVLEEKVYNLSQQENVTIGWLAWYTGIIAAILWLLAYTTHLHNSSKRHALNYDLCNVLRIMKKEDNEENKEHNRLIDKAIEEIQEVFKT